MRVVFPQQDAAEARRKARLPRYQLPAGDGAVLPFQTYVIALPSSTERRAAAAEQLAARHVNFTFFDAVDGHRALPQPDVRFHVGWGWSEARQLTALRCGRCGCCDRRADVPSQAPTSRTHSLCWLPRRPSGTPAGAAHRACRKTSPPDAGTARLVPICRTSSSCTACCPVRACCGWGRPACMGSRHGTLQRRLGGALGSRLRLPSCPAAAPSVALSASAAAEEMQLVLESDFRLLFAGGEWARRLRGVMEQLPSDWEVRCARSRQLLD